MWKVLGLAVAGLVPLCLIVVLGLYLRLNFARDRGELAADIDAAVAMWQKKGPRDLAVVIVKNGESRIMTYGPNAPDGEALFQIGSISKVFTGLLLQQMVDAGAVRMEATLGELMGQRYPLAPEVTDVTLLQLATHTSGLPRVPKPLEDQAIARAGGDTNLMIDPYSHLSRDEVLGYLANPVGKTEPGKFDYSNYGMGLLAHILELETGKTYPELLDEMIFTPLGMGMSYGDLPEEAAARLIQGHDASGKPVAPWRFTSLAGAGSITTSAEDMLKFMMAELDPASPLAGAMARQRAPQPNGSTAVAWMLPTILDRFQGNSEIVWHDGAISGYFAYLAIHPGRKNAVLILSNRQEDVTPLGVTLMRYVRTQSWAPLHSDTAQ